MAQGQPRTDSEGQSPGSDAPPFRYTAALAGTIETAWQERWEREGTFGAPGPGEPGFDARRPKYYILDMFPYPSGEGLHVGHPEGYTATDIVARYQRMQGRAVLHPMGWDAFGLPAEQYAVRTGVHPAITTKNAIETFRRQLRRFGFSYDWSREIATIDPAYYRWTQWVFLQLYNAWYDPGADRARPIAELRAALERDEHGISPTGDLVPLAPGHPTIDAAITGPPVGVRKWHELSQDERRSFIDSQRLAYLGEQTVNWCPKLGTVLANEEVVNGKSERGGHPVFRKTLRQWMFRITAYAERLLRDLDTVDWPQSTRTMQTEWIGRSEGAEIDFRLALGGPTLRGGSSSAPKGGAASCGLRDFCTWLGTPGQRRLRPEGFIGRDPYPPGIHGPVQDLVRRQHDLPHLRLEGATYFVTWRAVEPIHLDESEREIVLDALLHFDGERGTVYAASVMSNHVHAIVRPFPGHDLDEWVSSVKHFSSTQVNKRRGAKGHLWQAESFDHIIRDEEYFTKFVRYILDNPVEAGAVSRPQDYRWTFIHHMVSGDWPGPGAQGPAAERRATQDIRVYTTRPDTVFGATFMVLAPEHPLVDEVLAAPPPGADAAAIRAYVAQARARSEVERQTEGKDKTGAFSGLYAVNPASGSQVPVWIADYVLMGYGHGAIMAVPGHDQRDFEFARRFELPIRAVVMPPDAWLREHAAPGHKDKPPETLRSYFTAGPAQFGDTVFDGEGTATNSTGEGVSLDGLPTAEAKRRITEWLGAEGIGRRRVNYKLRDWLFSRQRYWGEPFPIVYDAAGNHYPVSEAALPVRLPEMEQYKPQESDEPRPMLAAAPRAWLHTTAAEAGVDPALLPPGTPVTREANTMPNWAGSCWYYLRFCDPRNDRRFVGKEAERYWMGSTGIDLYIGGAEHAVLHLLYARFWHKILFDLGHVSTPEPAKKLFHQGLITSYAYQRPDRSLVPTDQVEERGVGQFVDKATGKPLQQIVAKMSKSLKNVVNPDDVIAEYGADTMRLYEMYMGPLEASKPWNPRDIHGLFRFLQRAWRLLIDEQTGEPRLSESRGAGVPPAGQAGGPPDNDPLERALHRTIAKVGADIEALAFNTAIAAMIEFVNAATAAAGPLTRSQAERFTLTLSPFAPHLAEEAWQRLGHARTLAHEPWPKYDERLLTDEQVEIAVQINGKVRERITVPAGADAAALQKAALAEPRVRALIEGKTARKVIAVPGKLVNIVV